MKSAEDLRPFVVLRQLSWDTPLDQQAKSLLETLNKAVHYNDGTPIYTLCAIEMLLCHGKAGLLDEILSPENLHQLADYFQPGRRHPKVETQLLLVRYIKVGPLFE